MNVLRMKTTPNMHALGEQDFKSFAPEYSADSLTGTLDTPVRVIRRFNFGTSLRPIQAMLSRERAMLTDVGDVR